MIDFEKARRERRAKMTQEEREHEDKYNALVKFHTILSKKYNVYKDGERNPVSRKTCTIFRKVDRETLKVSDEVTIDFEGPYWSYNLNDEFMGYVKNSKSDKFYLDVGEDLYMHRYSLKRIIDRYYPIKRLSEDGEIFLFEDLLDQVVRITSMAQIPTSGNHKFLYKTKVKDVLDNRLIDGSLVACNRVGMREMFVGIVNSNSDIVSTNDNILVSKYSLGDYKIYYLGNSYVSRDSQYKLASLINHDETWAYDSINTILKTRYGLNCNHTFADGLCSKFAQDIIKEYEDMQEHDISELLGDEE